MHYFDFIILLILGIFNTILGVYYLFKKENVYLYLKKENFFVISHGLFSDEIKLKDRKKVILKQDKKYTNIYKLDLIDYEDLEINLFPRTNNYSDFKSIIDFLKIKNIKIKHKNMDLIRKFENLNYPIRN